MSYNPENDLLSERLSFMKDGSKLRLKQVSYQFETPLPPSNQNTYLNLKIDNLNAVKNGPDLNNRLGLTTKAIAADIKVECAYAGNNYTVQQPALATDLQAICNAYYNYIRFMVIWDNQPNGTLPNIQDIISDINSNGEANVYGGKPHANKPLPWAKPRHSTMDRFFVVRDLPLTLGDPQPALVQPDGSGNALSSSGSSPINYHKRFSINFSQEFARKAKCQSNITQYSYDPANQQNNFTINTGGLIYVFYSLKPDFYFKINSTVYYTDK